MTKLSYYLCTDAKGKESVMYGTSKKEVIALGEKKGLAFDKIEEQNFNDLKTKYNEKELLQIRSDSKTLWEKKHTSNPKKKKE